MKKDLDELSDTEVALKKWKSILDALSAIEDVSIQITSFCLRHQRTGCGDCPIIRYDYPCGHPYATFTLFYQELRKLKMIAERLYAILTAIDIEDKELRGRHV